MIDDVAIFDKGVFENTNAVSLELNWFNWIEIESIKWGSFAHFEWYQWVESC